jgi:L-iditol 2-dehydrogenase
MMPRRWRKQIIRTISRFFQGGTPYLIPAILRWAKVRAEAIVRLRGLVRGFSIVWPFSGRAWAVGIDLGLPGRGQVLVRVDASAVSPGTERAFFTRAPNAAAAFPYSPGYSGAGYVMATGRGVTSVASGDRVALVTGHASLAVAAESDIVPIPQAVTTEAAAFVQLGVIALHGLQQGRVSPGLSVAVIGQGVIGQIVVQLARAYGLGPICSIARTDRRVSPALRRAADQVTIVDRDGLEALGRVNAAVTFESSGAPEGIATSITCTAPGGRVVLLGSSRGATQMDFGAIADRGLEIVGAHITGLDPSAWRAYAQVIMSLLERGDLDLASLVEERVHPLEAEWFYRRLASRDNATLGAIFSWDRLPPADRLRRISLLTMPDLTPMQRGRLTAVPISRRQSINGGGIA